MPSFQARQNQQKCGSLPVQIFGFDLFLCMPPFKCMHSLSVARSFEPHRSMPKIVLDPRTPFFPGLCPRGPLGIKVQCWTRVSFSHSREEEILAKGESASEVWASEQERTKNKSADVTERERFLGYNTTRNINERTTADIKTRLRTDDTEEAVTDWLTAPQGQTQCCNYLLSTRDVYKAGHSIGGLEREKKSLLFLAFSLSLNLSQRCGVSSFHQCVRSRAWNNCVDLAERLNFFFVWTVR